MAALTEQPPLKICEFYSGIGGWRYALEKATSREDHDVALAVDASTTCNAIYAHNFGHKPSQRRVENLTTSDVAGADGWLLSPPCQPYTRQHEMTDIDDPRAASLLHLADLVEEAPPHFICLENVVGFAASESRDRWHGALRRAGFAQPKCWHLTPTQTGVPHERPRYFECAVRTNSDEDWASPAPTEDFEASGRDRSVSARGLPAMGWLLVFVVVGSVFAAVMCLVCRKRRSSARLNSEDHWQAQWSQVSGAQTPAGGAVVDALADAARDLEAGEVDAEAWAARFAEALAVLAPAHGYIVLSLQDNQPWAGAATKGRSPARAVNPLCRRRAALDPADDGARGIEAGDRPVRAVKHARLAIDREPARGNGEARAERPRVRRWRRFPRPPRRPLPRLAPVTSSNRRRATLSLGRRRTPRRMVTR